MTAQDQQSRAEFEAIYRSDAFQAGIPYGSSKEVAYAAWQAARALPAGMEPVAWLHVNRLGAPQAFTSEPPPGFKAQCEPLYTAAQVLAMGRVPPGWQAVPVEPTIAMLMAGDMPRISTEQTTKNHAAYAAMLAAAPRPPAAASQALPAMYGAQAPTTGAGSVTAGAAPAYRLLQRGVDTIQASDEFLADDGVTWEAVGRGIFVGMTYIGGMLPARRAIETGP